MRRLLIMMAALGLFLGACQSKEKAAEENPGAKTPNIDPSTYCQRGYEQAKTVIEGLPDAERPDRPLPDEDAYVAKCKKLPVDAQRCTMTDWATKHADSCDGVLGGLSEDDQKMMHALVPGDGPE